MDIKEAKEWLQGSMSMTNLIPAEPFDVRIAQADAAKMQEVKGNDSVVTEKMRRAGDEIASDMLDASIAKDMGGLGGSKKWEEWSRDYKGTDLDLIRQYLDEEIDSVTAIYIAMDRRRES